jgi:hypothetical protein
MDQPRTAEKAAIQPAASGINIAPSHLLQWQVDKSYVWIVQIPSSVGEISAYDTKMQQIVIIGRHAVPVTLGEHGV